MAIFDATGAISSLYSDAASLLTSARCCILCTNDVTRAGYKKALRSIKGWDAGGLTQAVDLTATPYVTSTRTRILKPVMAKKTWEKVADYAEPKAAAAK